jgi:hypothetical protein
VTRAAFTIASAASTTAGKPSVSTIPTAIDISYYPYLKFLDLENKSTQEGNPVNYLCLTGF